jgi:hypothetical protein
MSKINIGFFPHFGGPLKSIYILSIDREDFSAFWIVFSVRKLSSPLSLFWHETVEVRIIYYLVIRTNQKTPFTLQVLKHFSSHNELANGPFAL